MNVSVTGNKVSIECDGGRCLLLTCEGAQHASIIARALSDGLADVWIGPQPKLPKGKARLTTVVDTEDAAAVCVALSNHAHWLGTSAVSLNTSTRAGDRKLGAIWARKASVLNEVKAAFKRQARIK